jgi:hypothetical protein
MSEESLHRLEREVEAARAKLASDLSTLRSPATSAEFTATLKQEAKSSFQSTIHTLVEDIKARAAANPAAALAIGAGVAWRIIRHPPIATALVGAGLISLFRTAPARTNGQADYFSHAKARLREQAAQVADIAGEQAATMSDSVTQRTGELAAAAKERIQEWTTEAASLTKRAATDLGERAASISSQLTGVAGDQMREFRSSSSPSAVSDVVATARDLGRPAQQALNDPENRDKLLLGTAGVAIVAALGIALQRRFSEGDRSM